MVELIQNIPTNVITGFLGVGKSTAILHLLKHKPTDEHWAVLVNEFGKIGIDGTLLEQDGVAIKEVPGGCMCCAAGLSVQVGLNALLARARPDRFLIEPTGIGHPRQIIRQLSRSPFDSVLDMRACITLVDPRHLQDNRYTENEYYKEQLEIADVLVANKTDQCSESDIASFDRLVETRQPAASAKVKHGQINSDWLNLPHRQLQPASLLQASNIQPEPQDNETPDLDEGEICRREENQAGEFVSCGWRFADEKRFSFDKLNTLFSALDAERIKAVLKTDQGGMLFNADSDGMQHTSKDSVAQNRVELIRREQTDWDKIEQALLACLI